MKQRDRHTGLTRAGSNLRVLLEHFETARDRCEGLIARGYAGGSSSEGKASGHSDPTYAAHARIDHCMADLHQADEMLASLIKASDGLVDWIRQYPRATEATREIRERLGLPEEDWCASCARAKEGDHPWRQEIRGTPSDELAAELGVPRRPLCDWCYRFLYDHRCWPTVGIVEHRRKGGRVTVQQVETELGRAISA